MAQHPVGSGLTSAEARRRLDLHGPNELSGEKRWGFLTALASVLREPMFLLLLAAAGLYFLLGDAGEAATMLVFVLFVVSITLFQEWRTERALQALKDLASPRATVLRDGQAVSIPGREVVPGDWLVLAEGERIGADGEILQCADLLLDESLLTGESEPVWKVPAISSDDAAGPADAAAATPGQAETAAALETEPWRRDAVYAGTMVLQGQAVVLVTGTGGQTEYGKIGRSLSELESRPTPLQAKTRRLIATLGWSGVAFFTGVVLLAVWRGHSWIEAFVAGIALAMAMIPEEFPVVLTVFLALGAWRLTQRQALMRRVPAVETLGAATVLCVDKTGTLTQNRMAVRALIPAADLPGGGASAAGLPGESATAPAAQTAQAARLAALACETDPYDPMEQAIYSAAAEYGVDAAALHRQAHFLKEYAFQSDTRRMAHLWELDGEVILAAKGSPETLLPLCRLSPEDRALILEEAEVMASQGLRVLALASANGLPLPRAGATGNPGPKLERLDTRWPKSGELRAPWPDDLADYDLRFIGLLGLADPPRPEAAAAVGECRQAGIRVVMISGDHAATARAIASEVGIVSEQVLTGGDVDRLTDDELVEAVADVGIFARVVPAHKLRIVRALRRRGEVVAMTGDGVNDAPALKESDIGVAMGKRGTQVAREAADMILLDDNFATIVSSVRDGRRIYDNIKKAIAYIMAVHIPIAGLALLAPLFGLPLLLFPVHIVLLELILDPTCSIVFESEPGEPNLMRRPPRSPAEPLVDWRLAVQVAVTGGSVLAAAFLSYWLLLRSGVALDAARTFSLLTLVLGNILLVLVSSSLRQPVWRLLGRANPARYWVNGLALAALLAVVYIPLLQGAFGTTALPALQTLKAFGLASVAAFWWELFKPLFWRRVPGGE